MLDVRKLRALRAIARCGSFSAAAEDLNYSQSAISQQVAQLERQVGTLLVERRGRTVRLTVAGRKLVDRADRILRHLEDAEAELAAISTAQGAVIRLVTSGSAVSAWVPSAVARFHSRRRGHALVVTAASAGTALELLGDGDADIAVLPVPARDLDPALTSIELFADPVRLLLPTSHRLAARPTVRLADLADEPWVVTKQSVSDDLGSLLAACRRAGFDPRICRQAEDEITLQGLVATGAGVALAPDLVCATFLRRDIVARSLDVEEVTYPVIAATAGALLEGTPVAALLDELVGAAKERALPAGLAARAGVS